MMFAKKLNLKITIYHNLEPSIGGMGDGALLVYGVFNNGSLDIGIIE